jgi:hypothetical protein
MMCVMIIVHVTCLRSGLDLVKERVENVQGEEWLIE